MITPSTPRKSMSSMSLRDHAPAPWMDAHGSCRRRRVARNMNNPKAARYVMPYQWMDTGPSWSATGSMRGYINAMRLLCPRAQLLPREGDEALERGRHARCRPHQRRFALGHALHGTVDHAGA